MKVFATQTGAMAVVPSIVSPEICKQYGFKKLLTLEEKIEDIYLISVEKRVKHEAVASILAHASKMLA